MTSTRKTIRELRQREAALVRKLRSLGDTGNRAERAVIIALSWQLQEVRDAIGALQSGASE
jgi:hypothetical protein